MALSLKKNFLKEGGVVHHKGSIPAPPTFPIKGNIGLRTQV